jgi:hypothetical protein
MQALAAGNGDGSHVGPVGAGIFNSALLRVGEVNNIPLGTPSRDSLAGASIRERVGFAMEWFAGLAGSWLHGTMLSRMRYVSRISDDPRDTHRFDRRMVRVRLALLALLLSCGAWATVVTLADDGSTDAPASAQVTNVRPARAAAVAPPA